ncbi:hypothetical protein SDC9_52913 [bioreactor metagenome]|uniref:Uncharacterized protein n=1 Tax=bioreactor metagenome TaxID=1076179 RepID=A0A644WSV4_9ZZZZ
MLPSFIRARAAAISPGRIAGGRPPLRPRCRASTSPAVVRSRIRARSNWAIAPKTWKVSMPPGVVVSMLSVKDTSPIFARSNSSAVAMSFFSDRANRSSFQTTSVSPVRSTSERIRPNSGRSSRAPDPRSVNTFSQPARLSASS